MMLDFARSHEISTSSNPATNNFY